MAGIKIKLKTTNGRGKVKRFDVDKLSNLAVQQQYQRKNTEHKVEGGRGRRKTRNCGRHLENY
jgi:hypothetical protein